MKDSRIFLSREKKTGIVLLLKRTKGFFLGMLKSSDFLGHKIRTSVEPPPLSLKFVSGAPGMCSVCVLSLHIGQMLEPCIFILYKCKLVGRILCSICVVVVKLLSFKCFQTF